MDRELVLPILCEGGMQLTVNGLCDGSSASEQRDESVRN